MRLGARPLSRWRGADTALRATGTGRLGRREVFALYAGEASLPEDHGLEVKLAVCPAGLDPLERNDVEDRLDNAPEPLIGVEGEEPPRPVTVGLPDSLALVTAVGSQVEQAPDLENSVNLTQRCRRFRSWEMQQAVERVDRIERPCGELQVRTIHDMGRKSFRPTESNHLGREIDASDIHPLILKPLGSNSRPGPDLQEAPLAILPEKRMKDPSLFELPRLDGSRVSSSRHAIVRTCEVSSQLIRIHPTPGLSAFHRSSRALRIAQHAIIVAVAGHFPAALQSLDPHPLAVQR